MGRVWIKADYDHETGKVAGKLKKGGSYKGALALRVSSSIEGEAGEGSKETKRRRERYREGKELFKLLWRWGIKEGRGTEYSVYLRCQKKACGGEGY